MTEGSNAINKDKTDGRTLRNGPRGPYTRRMAEGDDPFRRFAATLSLLMEAIGIPVYRRKKSNHIYSHRQKIALLVLRERLGLSYEQFERDLPSYRGFLDELGMTRIPCNSTLIRFNACVDHDDLQKLITAFSVFCGEEVDVATDCTGFSNFLRSAHYSKRCRDFGIKGEPRSFTKLSLSVDVKTHIILSGRASAKKRHDSQFVVEQAGDLMEAPGLNVRYWIADKGYDSEPLHRYVRGALGCITVIPCRRSRGNRGYSTHGVYRNQMKEGIRKGGALKAIYDSRPQVETSNFMVKGHTGSHILSRIE